MPAKGVAKHAEVATHMEVVLTGSIPLVFHWLEFILASCQNQITLHVKSLDFGVVVSYYLLCYVIA